MKKMEDMSDEELLSLNAPPSSGSEVSSPSEPVPEGGTPAELNTAELPTPVETPNEEGGTPAVEGGTPEADSGTPEAGETGTPAQGGTPASGEGEPEKAAAAAEKVEPAATPIDYKAEYERLMAPLRANGKDIELKSTDELLTLAKMGANYTKNMQNIRHHKKSLMMLERNGLLDEAKISYLIDLSNGDPRAIQKLLKEKNVDPLDVNIREDVQYKDQGNHQVTDDEVAFRERVEEIVSTPEGVETINVFNTWDDPSKKLLWQNPQLMSTIHEHRKNGTFQVVAEEVARRQAIGQIGPSVPFLTAYEAVGEELVRQQQQRQAAASTPVATRVATPATPVKDNAKAAAAAPTRAGTRGATPLVNPLALSDEDFEKEFQKFQGRL